MNSKPAKAARTEKTQIVKQNQFLQRLQTANNSRTYKCLIYGPSRSGKTTFAATSGLFDQSAPALLLDFEGGSGSAAGIDNVSVLNVSDWKDFNEACEFIWSDANIFKTVIVDSISELHVFSLLGIIDHEMANNQNRASRGDHNTPEQSDYGKSLVQMRRFLRTVRDLPVHVIVTSLSTVEVFPREGNVRVPALFGKLSTEVVGMFPIVGYLVNEKERNVKSKEHEFKRQLYLQNTEGMRVGVRKPFTVEFPNVLENPNVEKLFTMLNQAYGG